MNIQKYFKPVSFLAEEGLLPLTEGGLDPLVADIGLDPLGFSPAVPDLPEAGLLPVSGLGLPAADRTDPVLDPPGLGLAVPDLADPGLEPLGLAASDRADGCLSLLDDLGRLELPEPLLLPV